MRPSEEEQLYFVKICAFLSVPLAGASFLYLSARPKDLAALAPFRDHPDKWYIWGLLVFMVLGTAFAWCYSGLSRRGNIILFVIGAMIAGIHVWYSDKI